MKHSILIANRGEIAVRVARACADLGIRSVAVYSLEDSDSLHVRLADDAHPLPKAGAAAYLDIDSLIQLAQQAGCTAIHPGYGFLSESAELADACAVAGLYFIGPSPDTLRLYGDKASARREAERNQVPVLMGTQAAVDLNEATRFFHTMEGRGMMVKAVSGGGGRGMRKVLELASIAEALAMASAEAKAAFGCGDLYCEELIGDARHIEVQILGDGNGNVMHFGERECSLQRHRQKVLEIAPSPSLSQESRERIIDAAVRMASAVGYLGLGTFEFLVDRQAPERFVFIETNPRVQVEHTVTEEIYGVDLVQAQIRVCLGASLETLSSEWGELQPKGYALQMRINMESLSPDGKVLPSAGRLSTYDLPTGPGVRVDGFGYVGYQTHTAFDSLLAKVIVHSPTHSYGDVIQRAKRALKELRIEGVNTNIAYLAAALDFPQVRSNEVSTSWLDDHLHELIAAQEARVSQAPGLTSVGALSDQADTWVDKPDGAETVAAPLQGVVQSVSVQPGDRVQAGQQLAVLEAMKMQYSIEATVAGTVHSVLTEVGSMLAQDQPVAFLMPDDSGGAVASASADVDLQSIRPDLAASIAAHELTLDAARPEAIKKRHALGYRSARENIAAVMDADSFLEYGALAIAGQRGRHPLEHLKRVSPADGIVCGVGTVNAADFGNEDSRTYIAAYDYTVFAGTQGTFNHKKQDRIFELAAKHERPVVLFAEGGGGRPGETDKALIKVASLDIATFKVFASLSGLVPVVGIANGRCFAGNAALLGCSDVIIATRSSNIGMGGPAMIEGGGLGVYTPEEIGPVDVQAPNGVIDVLVDDEQQAAAVARQYLSYFQGSLQHWSCADQRLLRHCVPENRVRAYDVRKVITTLADTDSVLELRRDFGKAMITALVRLEGQPVGLIANNPMHLGGAIDADAADKAAHFLALCDAHGLPILSLCDTPGFMVGPDAEKTAQVRRVSRMFVNTANMQVPLVMVVLRKGYGLGALAMAGGNFQDTAMSVSWPTGEFGGMGLEGAVRLGFRRELEAIADPVQRDAEFQRRVAAAYEHGKALNMASVTEIDDVIDPAQTRFCVLAALKTAMKERSRRSGRTRSHIETW